MHTATYYAPLAQVRYGFCLILLLMASLAWADSPQAFLPEDDIAAIQSKILENGYDFTVAPNWVTELPDGLKPYGRRPPVQPEPYAMDMGPLERISGRVDLPASFDWRDYEGRSYIGEVRNQGSCGSCYAFGACAAAEGVYNAANNLYDDNTVDFSESYIIWCLGFLPKYSSHFQGCDGADYDYYEVRALTVEGATYERNFPYMESSSGPCPYKGDELVVFDSWNRVPCNDIDAIKTAIMTYGVVDAAVYVSTAFEAYQSGLYEDTKTTCTSFYGPCYYADTDHSIALVGWNDNGDAENNGYWILRNSWGTDWGEDGYMRIKYTSAHVGCAVVYLTYSSAHTASVSINAVYQLLLQ